MAKRIILVLILVAMVAFGGCKKEQKVVVVASKPVTEGYILAEMLTLLIEAKSDIQVKQTLGIGGGTSNIHPALIKGEIDLYPEYTGTGWLFVLKRASQQDAQKLYEQVKQAYQQEYGLVWSGLYGFNNTYAVAVSEGVAQRYALKTVSDLVKVSPALTFAANPDFLEREDGYPNLTKTYGLSFKAVKEIDIGLRYEAIKSEGFDVIMVFSTDGRLNVEPVVVLEDDRSAFAAYHAATVVRSQTLENYPELSGVLELLSARISNQEMIGLNYQVEIEKQDPKEVARAFLVKEGLL